MSPFPLGILAAAGAGAAEPAMDLLQTTILAAGASSVTLTGINSYTDYKHLQLRVVINEDRDSPGSGYTDMKMQINGDTATNYARHVLRGRHTGTVSSEASVPTNAIRIRCSPTDSSNNFGASVVDFLDFLDTNKYTTVRALSGVHTPTESEVNLTSGVWLNTNAVSSLTFPTVYGGDFVVGTRFSLYGIKG